MRSVSGAKPKPSVKKKGTTRVISGLTHSALAHALNAPTSSAVTMTALDIDPQNFIISAENAAKPKMRRYGSAKGGTITLLLPNAQEPLASRKSRSVDHLLDAGKSIADRLRIVGIQPGGTPNEDKINKLMRSIRAGAVRITGSTEVASRLLSNNDFDGTGLNVEQLVRTGRAGRVLSRLDDLRYGARD